MYGYGGNVAGPGTVMVEVDTDTAAVAADLDQVSH